MNVALVMAGARVAFSPGEMIEGEIQYSCSDPVARVEVRLFWYTEGKGTQDVQVVAWKVADELPGRGNVGFRFAAPQRPVSCSGTLVSVRWALEVVAPGAETQRVELVIGPRGQETRLGKVR